MLFSLVDITKIDSTWYIILKINGICVIFTHCIDKLTLIAHKHILCYSVHEE